MKTEHDITGYFLPKVKTKDYNVMINGKKAFLISQFKEIQNIC